jgi:hypothetical protein
MIRCFLLNGALMGRCNAEAVVIMGWMTCWVMVGAIAEELAIGAMAGMVLGREFDIFLSFEFGTDRRKLKYNNGHRRFRALKVKCIRGSGWPLF